MAGEERASEVWAAPALRRRDGVLAGVERHDVTAVVARLRVLRHLAPLHAAVCSRHHMQPTRKGIGERTMQPTRKGASGTGRCRKTCDGQRQAIPTKLGAADSSRKRRRPFDSECSSGSAGPLCHICAGTGLAFCHICAGTGLTPPTSAPGLGSSHTAPRVGQCAHACKRCDAAGDAATTVGRLATAGGAPPCRT